ncbi:MAG: hypothetical protein JW850_20740 [Thermoflexales bacterium]|nr:hypothetical protein [Thermoflexales bacterium]
MHNTALGYPAARQVSSPLVPTAEFIGGKMVRTLKYYVHVINKTDGRLFEIPLRAIYLAGDAYAAYEVDVERLGHVRVATLIEKDLLVQLKAIIGLPVWVTEKNGVTYVVQLKPRPRVRLPAKVALDLAQRPAGEYVIGFGQSHRGPVWKDLRHLTHIIVAGSSDSGKSAFLRSLVYQLARQPLPVELYLADMEGLTFAWAESWPILQAPIAQDVESATRLAGKLLAEIDRRSVLYAATGRFPESLAEYHEACSPPRAGEGSGEGPRLPWIVAIFDEFSALIEAAGRNSELARYISQLAMRSRKYGVTLVLAGQDFKANLLDTRITNQLKTRVQFRCARREQSEVVLGQGGAEHITIPGRALVRLDGESLEVQTFWVDKKTVVEASRQVAAAVQSKPLLSPDEQAVANLLLKSVEAGGEGGIFRIDYLAAKLARRVSRNKIKAIGQKWEACGWLLKPDKVTEGRAISDEFRRLAKAGG